MRIHPDPLRGLELTEAALRDPDLSVTAPLMLANIAADLDVPDEDRLRVAAAQLVTDVAMFAACAVGMIAVLEEISAEDVLRVLRQKIERG